ncbi:MAG: response regulator transcription factor, partial [Anaerolineae bacterium]|nr:response regulator transcription factor [Anaerolineae bacterium]
MTDPYKIRLLVVDDHDMLREGLAAFLRAFPDLDLIGEAGGGEEAIQQCRDLQPDVVLMDLIMPEVDGVTAIGIIHQEMPDIKIVALSSFGEDKLVRDAL